MFDRYTMVVLGALLWAGCKSGGDAPPTESRQPAAAQASTPAGAVHAHDPPVAASPAPAGSVPVATYGALRAIFHQGDTAPKVALSAVAGPTVQAVGALSELRGEVTIVDGTMWLAYPDGKGGVKVESAQQSDERATLLVTASVDRWHRITIDEDIEYASLDGRLEELFTTRGMDVTQVIPMRIEGPLESLEWHVLDPSRAGDEPATSHADHQRMSVRGTVPQAQGVLVGFFSKQHHGVFTHMGSNSHFHVVLSKEKISGHVDGVVIKRGATLLLPR